MFTIEKFVEISTKYVSPVSFSDLTKVATNANAKLLPELTTEHTAELTTEQNTERTTEASTKPSLEERLGKLSNDDKANTMTLEFLANMTDAQFDQLYCKENPERNFYFMMRRGILKIRQMPPYPGDEAVAKALASSASVLEYSSDEICTDETSTSSPLHFSWESTIIQEDLSFSDDHDSSDDGLEPFACCLSPIKKIPASAELEISAQQPVHCDQGNAPTDESTTLYLSSVSSSSLDSSTSEAPFVADTSSKQSISSTSRAPVTTDTASRSSSSIAPLDNDDEGISSEAPSQSEAATDADNENAARTIPHDNESTAPSSGNATFPTTPRTLDTEPVTANDANESAIGDPTRGCVSVDDVEDTNDNSSHATQTGSSDFPFDPEETPTDKYLGSVFVMSKCNIPVRRSCRLASKRGRWHQC